MTDHRMNLDLITDMFGLLHRHGYTRGDNEHTGRAILLLGDLARIYEGSQDHTFGPYIGEALPRPEPVPPEPATRDAVSVPVVAYQVSGEFSIIKAAAERGWIDEKAAVFETLTGIHRAGADLIITYWAPAMARWLSE